MFTLRGHFYRKLARTGLVTAALPESKRVGKNVIKWNLFSSIDSKYWYSIQENWHPFSEVTLWKFWTRLSTKTENGKKENSTILVTFYVQSFPPKMSLNHLLLYVSFRIATFWDVITASVSVFQPICSSDIYRFKRVGNTKRQKNNENWVCGLKIFKQFLPNIYPIFGNEHLHRRVREMRCRNVLEKGKFWMDHPTFVLTRFASHPPFWKMPQNSKSFPLLITDLPWDFYTEMACSIGRKLNRFDKISILI